MIDAPFAVPPFPRLINVETTNRCNLRCPICPRLHSMHRPVGDMDWPLFREVIDQIAATSPVEEEMVLGLHLFGEPLLHRQVLEQIHYAKQAIPRSILYLSTNATLLDASMGGSLVSSGLDWIVLSLDGATRETYERVRSGASFARTVDNVRGFLAAALAQGNRDMRIWLQLIAADQDLATEVTAFRREWGSWEERLPNCRLVIKPAIDWAGQVAMTSPTEHDPMTNLARPQHCRRVLEQLNVYWNGEVTACCYDVDGLMRVGSLTERSLVEIWQGEQIGFLRQVFREGRQRRLPLCRTCEEAD